MPGYARHNGRLVIQDKDDFPSLNNNKKTPEIIFHSLEINKS